MTAAEDLSSFDRGVFGHDVKIERLRRGLSVERAAKKGHLSHVTWRRIEKGQAVNERSYIGVDMVFDLAPGTALQILSSECNLGEAVNDRESLTLAEERERNDSGRRYGIEQVMATINAETIPDLIDHASRRLRQALAVLMEGHREEVAELRAENAALAEALDRLRPLRHTPYVDEEHQGGNCADLVPALVVEKYLAEAALRKVRDWCDRCDEDETWLGATAEVRALLPVVES